MRARLWPIIAVTLLTGCAFAALKFLLINKIAIDFTQADIDAVGVDWIRDLVQACYERKQIKEALSQGYAAALTGGILAAYLINAPLAGAWRCGTLLAWSIAGMAVGPLVLLLDDVGVINVNDWLLVFVLAIYVGAVYGTVCAVRGKAIPVTAAATGRTNTQVGGFLNAALVIGLLFGTVVGNVLYDYVTDPMEAMWPGYLVVVILLGVAVWCATRIDAAESTPMPFREGFRQLASGTTSMLRQQWAVLIAGGMAWGIASAASLAAFIDGVDRLGIESSHASALVIFPALGAIGGNLASVWFTQRRQVIASFVLMAVAVGAYPLVVVGWVSAAVMMVLVGALFAAPTNVLDARFLARASACGLSGRGGTVMSLVHNIFIFGVGGSLAVALFLRWMRPEAQFWLLAACSLACAVVSIFAHLEEDAGRSARMPAAH